MENLNSSNLILKTLKPKEYSNLIDDLNYNFKKILNLPGFKGIQGESVQGEQGVGIRGSKWVFVNFDTLAEEYELTDFAEINIDWINNAYQQDPARFFGTLFIPNDENLILGDILVLPDGEIITLSENISEGQVSIGFVPTGITFNDVTSVSESRVVEIFNSMYSQANTGIGATRHYGAIAKNATDGSPQLNDEMNQDSAVDIQVSGSGPGVFLDDYSYLGMAEQAVNISTQFCHLVGSSKMYHNLIQNTQEDFNNNYTPGVDDFASLVILQNNNKNGIVFGNKNNNNLRNFSRLYNNNGTAILTSSYSPNPEEYAELLLNRTESIIRALKFTINTNTTEILSENFKSNYLDWDQFKAMFGMDADKKLWIGFNQGVYLKNIKNADFLTTDQDGRIIKKYSKTETIDENSTNQQIPTAKSVHNFFNYLENNYLQDFGSLNEEMSKRVFMTRYEAQINNNALTASNLTNHGTYTLLKGNTLLGNVGQRNNAVLANDGLLSVFRWTDESTNYIYVVQELRIKHPMFVPNNDNFDNYVNSDEYTEESNKELEHVLTRRGYKYNVGNENVFNFTSWKWDLNDASMFSTEGPIQIVGSLKNNNLIIRHSKSNINYNSGQTNPLSPIGNVSGLTDTFNGGNLTTIDSVLDSLPETKVVSDVTFDDYGHAQQKEKTELKDSLVSYDEGGVSSIPYERNGDFTVNEILNDRIKQLMPKIINTPLANLYGNTGWTTIPYDNSPTDPSSHNLRGHDVQYKTEFSVTSYSYVYFRINNINDEFIEWNDSNCVASSFQIIGSNNGIVRNNSQYTEGGWTVFKLNIGNPSNNITNTVLRAVITRI